LSYQQSPPYWTVCADEKRPNEDKALPLLSPTPASALLAKGAKSAKGARMRKVQRDMTIVHGSKITAANGASKINKKPLSL
jgi:hypothetical protein